MVKIDSDESSDNSGNNMLRFWPFVGKSIGIGWDKSREKFGLAVDIGLLLLATALVILTRYSRNHPKFNADKGENFMSYWTVVIPGILWLIWLGYHTIKASHEIYAKEANNRMTDNDANKSKIKVMGNELAELIEKTKPLTIENIVLQKASDFEFDYTYLVKIYNPSKATPADHLKLELVSIEQIPFPNQNFPLIPFRIAFPLRLSPALGYDLQVNPCDSTYYNLCKISFETTQPNLQFWIDERL
jgi:hypothetical protein